MSAHEMERALAALKAGGFVAYPTETCYGLGAPAADEAAVDRLRDFKGKGHAPMSLLIAEPSWAEALAAALSPSERKLIAAFWPGPLTLLVLPPAGTPFAHLAAPRLALRCSSHPVARELAARFGAPLTSTSANFHGGGFLRSEREVRKVFGAHGVPILADPTPAPVPGESTLAYLDDGNLVVIREGMIARSALEAVLRA